MSKQAAKNEDPQLALDSETIEAPAVEAVAAAPAEPAPEPKDVGGEVEESIANLKQQVEAANQAKAQAERQAQEARRQAQQAQIDAQRAQNRAQDTDLHLVKQAISTVKGRMLQAKADIKEAMGVGDYEKAAELQETMSFAAADLRDLERGLTDLERRKAEPPPPAPVADMAEAFIQSLQTAPSRRWADQHRDFIKDERSVRRIYRAHEDALDEGMTADSDDYFKFVENRLGLNKPEPKKVLQDENASDPISEAARPVQREVPPPSAPASRGSSRPGTVRLTAEERDMAEMMGISPEAYARNREALRSEGKIH